MELNNNDQRTLHAPSVANPDYRQDTYKWLRFGGIIVHVYQQLGTASVGASTVNLHCINILGFIFIQMKK